MRLLLIDTCGDVGSLALADHDEVLRERSLPARSASAELVRVVREELEALAWPLRSLDAVSVVNGPGSFTGVRVGLAAAKGFCDVAGLRLVTLSRLEVLLASGTAEGTTLAVLDAGRGEFYVRSSYGHAEELLAREELLTRIAVPAGVRVLVAEEKVLVALQAVQPQWISLSAAHARALTAARLGIAAESVATADANYVRHARTLYAAGRSTRESAEHS